MQRKPVTLCLAVVPAISHHSAYVMFAVRDQQTSEMNVNEASPSFSPMWDHVHYQTLESPKNPSNKPASSDQRM